jgi:hypothetical protein
MFANANFNVTLLEIGVAQVHHNSMGMYGWSVGSASVSGRDKVARRAAKSLLWGAFCVIL